MFIPVFLFFAFGMIHQNHGGRIFSSSSNTSCTVQSGNRLLHEGEKITMNGKLYKVEECILQRAYQTCGTHLWFMINIVCEAIEVQKQKNPRAYRMRRFAQEKLLSEACCEHSCTVTEMTRYCPS